MTRKTDEPYLSYVERVSQALIDGTIGYAEWSKDVVGEELYSSENLRRCAVFFQKFLDTLDDEMVEACGDVDRVAELKEAKDELIKERKRMQQQNNELQETYRYQARNELFKDRIVEAIEKLEPMKVKTICLTSPIETTGLLCLSDFHAGSTYEVKGLHGEVVNEYNFDIMCDRMWRLLGMLEEEDMPYDNLVVANLGDFFENILRMSSLTKLREPVLDTVIKFSEFMSKWLVEANDRLGVPIDVVTVGGNHDVTRILGSKPEFEDENLGKIVVEFLKLRLKDCKNIKIEDYTDVTIKTIHGSNLMFAHGTDSDLVDALEYFSNLYAMDADAIYAGHLHRPETKTVGIADVGDREVIRVGSICGVDPYAKRIRKSARPSAYFALYDDNGRGWTKNYYLG